jgi:hypothetical protein
MCPHQDGVQTPRYLARENRDYLRGLLWQRQPSRRSRRSGCVKLVALGIRACLRPAGQVVRAVRGVPAAGPGSPRAARDRVGAAGSGGGLADQPAGDGDDPAPLGGDHGLAAADAVAMKDVLAAGGGGELVQPGGPGGGQTPPTPPGARGHPPSLDRPPAARLWRLLACDCPVRWLPLIEVTERASWRHGPRG